MSPIRRPPSTLSAVDAPCVDVILAFFTQVLHVPAPERLLLHSFEWVVDIPFSPLMRTVIPARYAAKIVLDAPLPSIGNKILLAFERQGDSYAITEMVFEPGWRQVP